MARMQPFRTVSEKATLALPNAIKSTYAQRSALIPFTNALQQAKPRQDPINYLRLQITPVSFWSDQGHGEELCTAIKWQPCSRGDCRCCSWVLQSCERPGVYFHAVGKGQDVLESEDVIGSAFRGNDFSTLP
mmetsp:Transcript_14129/g.27788  ORF Transcript_14129/g.27788 Transcript_14129/m.27788 type:complete len:132 (-) Transcript_14129:772-1167(-)